MDHLRAMHVFVRVAELGSLSAASADLGHARGVASAIVSELERYLGVQLFERTTRRLRLTEEGAFYLPRARSILADVRQLEEEVGGAERAPRGLLRVQIPSGLTRWVVVPGLPRFAAAYPGIELQILARNSLPDFAADRIDAAVVVGDLPDMDVVARAAGSVTRLTVASPEYLAARGAPRCPADLAAHACLPLLSSTTGRAVPWIFRDGDKDAPLNVSGPVSFESTEAALEAALHGAGIVQIASYMLHEDVRAGRLVGILDDFRPAPARVHIVHSRHRLKPRKLKIFEDFLMEQNRRLRRTWGEANHTANPAEKPARRRRLKAPVA